LLSFYVFQRSVSCLLELAGLTFRGQAQFNGYGRNPAIFSHFGPDFARNAKKSKMKILKYFPAENIYWKYCYLFPPKSNGNGSGTYI
jgi:hypothetical protein